MATAAATAALAMWRLGPALGVPTSGARVVYWLALALPLPALLLPATDRFLVLVAGRGGTFEALGTGAFAACAASGTHLLASLRTPRRPSGTLGAVLLVATAVVAGLAAALVAVL